ncbi:MAG TPA: methionyl-tRNA formyltransferase [Bacillota bacterium]|nr:methionyl-tRNA formyltransferase [Bacillota bacterium]
MRILVIGQAPFGRDCLQTLINQGENIVGAVTVPDVTGAKKTNPFKELVLEKGLPLLQPGRLRDPEVRRWVKDLAPDLLVLVFVTDFVPKEVIDLAPLGGINYHPSILPKYRGGNAIAWAIICGEKETGVTIHYIDEGVDTGDIILQEKVPIEPEDNTVTLYYNKLYPLGVRLTAEAVRLIKEGRAPRIPQDSRLASYQPVLKEKDTVIDWRQPAGNIYNLVRGSMPFPGAGTTFRGEKIVVLEAFLPDERISAAGAVPGEVVDAVSGEDPVVATGRGVLKLKTIRVGREKMPAAEWGGKIRLNRGDFLGR